MSYYLLSEYDDQWKETLDSNVREDRDIQEENNMNMMEDDDGDDAVRVKS